MTLAIVLLVLLLSSISNSPVAWAAAVEPGVKIFQVRCAGCHPQGGNIIRRGKTLKQRALHRNHLDSSEAIAALVKNGKNNMSAFDDRLNPQEIEAVSAYVWEQAQQGWPRR